MAREVAVRERCANGKNVRQCGRFHRRLGSQQIGKTLSSLTALFAVEIVWPCAHLHRNAWSGGVGRRENMSDVGAPRSARTPIGRCHRFDQWPNTPLSQSNQHATRAFKNSSKRTIENAKNHLLPIACKAVSRGDWCVGDDGAQAVGIGLPPIARMRHTLAAPYQARNSRLTSSKRSLP